MAKSKGYSLRVSSSGDASSRSIATYFTANGARLQARSEVNDLRRLSLLPHGDVSELTSL